MLTDNRSSREIVKIRTILAANARDACLRMVAPSNERYLTNIVRWRHQPKMPLVLGLILYHTAGCGIVLDLCLCLSVCIGVLAIRASR